MSEITLSQAVADCLKKKRLFEELLQRLYQTHCSGCNSNERAVIMGNIVNAGDETQVPVVETEDSVLVGPITGLAADGTMDAKVRIYRTSRGQRE